MSAYGAGFHLIAEDLGQFVGYFGEPGFETAAEYRAWRRDVDRDWFDRAVPGLHRDVKAFLKPRLAFADFLLARERPTGTAESPA